MPTVLEADHFASRAHVPWHQHAGKELVLVTEGECDIQVGDERLSGKSGTLFILPAGIPQYQYTREFVRTSYVVVRSHTVGIPADPPRPLTLNLDLAAAPARWLEDICNLSAASPGLEGVRAGLAQALLAYVNPIESTSLSAVPDNPTLDAALAFLQSYPLDTSSPLADQIARHACVSVSHLNALFRKGVGCGPVEYHLRMRLEHAQQLLQNPQRTIQQVAHACGFTDVNYFTRLFRQRYGMPPGAWRQTAQ